MKQHFFPRASPHRISVTRFFGGVLFFLCSGRLSFIKNNTLETAFYQIEDLNIVCESVYCALSFLSL